MPLTLEERQILRSILQDDIAFMQTFMEIPPKKANSPRSKFVLWPAQHKLISSMAPRNLVLKDSQIGCTSAVTGLFLKRVITTPDTTAVIMAHKEFLTSRLLHRVHVMYDSIPDQFKPRLDHKSSYEMRFPDINSVMYIGTAMSQVFGRGEPIHYLLFSEEAFYPPRAHEQIILPSLQRVPAGGIVFRESTPNGEPSGPDDSGFSFYNEVQQALKGESTFKLHTLWWWENPDNQMEPDDPLIAEYPSYQQSLELTEEERVLQQSHTLTEPQLRWRRWKIREMDIMFWQEHLESLSTCFLTVGQPYYDARLTADKSRLSIPAPHSGPAGSLVWCQPAPNCSYIMGIDPGMGKQSESVASVWQIEPDHLRQVARLSGYYEPESMIPRVLELGRYYNTALLVPEDNNHGLALIAGIKHYPRLYWRRDIISGIAGMQIGWNTSPRTKPFMMQEVGRRLPLLESADAEFWRQVRGWREVGGGKVESLTATDHFMAAALAIVGTVGFNPGKRRGYVGSSGWNW